ncbi:hypothetical protein [Nonomuraea dietziae]|uniref:hypothetical protein n=1 Tax=Nonomuraea dietziae TaxID=65515 RepID=UPI0031E45561
MAPERTIQGQALRELVELPQVIGGLDEASLREGVELFEGLADRIVPRLQPSRPPRWSSWPTTATPT